MLANNRMLVNKQINNNNKQIKIYNKHNQQTANNNPHNNNQIMTITDNKMDNYR